ncbi:major facilitator superfamily domain-containing protein 12 [Caerostris extrusa]|uniref:Major facilitator superfamily domain-containing protein 12 n=1 Tax=Caerostris extrusa TaxID=172846 RepID=A0AAV4SJX0_CAEEX|nr:major facilitator superfamily domain-containing protein 12 [Caerostris extrusa]
MGHGTAYCSQGVYGVGVLMGAASSTLVICALSFIHDLIGTSVESAAFVVICINCDWFYKNVMSYGVGGVGIVASIVIVTLLPANLGERQSAFNGAGLTPKADVTDIHRQPEPNEKQPLLQK